MAYEVTIRDNILFITYTGTLDAPDLHRLADELASLEHELSISPHRFIDLSPCERIDLDFAEMASFTSNRRKAPLKNPFKSALVAPKPIHYGFARMFSMLSDHPDIDMQIFPNVEAAWAWLTAS
jgi:hypothetical protein